MKLKFSLRDLFSEALAGVLQRPMRTMLTMVGVVLGVGTVVAVLGLTSSATGQISKRFDALVATEVGVREAPAAPGASGPAFPDDADRKAKQLNGVRSAGVYWAVSSKKVGDVTGVVIPGARADQLPVIAASPGALPALKPTLQAGRLFDEALDDRAERVAVLGSGAAQRLGVTNLDTRPVIFIGGAPMTVIGILADVDRKSEVLSAIIVPNRTAKKIWGEPGKDDQLPQMVIDTDLGAANVVSTQVAFALRPDRPDVFEVVPPPDPRALRDDIATDLNALFLLLAGVCLVIGSVGIANTTLVAVLERTSEIGLRRALGARRRHVATQFLAESGITGTVGGVLGASLGVVATLAVALVKEWTAIVPTGIVLAAPLIGTVTGLLAGAYPAIRAARIEPVEAFRR